MNRLSSLQLAAYRHKKGIKKQKTVKIGQAVCVIFCQLLRFTRRQMTEIFGLALLVC